MPGSFVKHVGSVGSAAGVPSLTHEITVPAGGVPIGNTILLGLSNDRSVGVPPTITDDRGNEWVEDVTDHSGLLVRGGVFRCHPTTALQAGDTITITLDEERACAAHADEFDGILTATALDQAAGDNGISEEPDSGEVTTLQGEEVAWGVICSQGADIDFDPADWTERAQVEGAAPADGLPRAVRCAYKILDATGTHSAAGSLTIGGLPASERWVALIATYKAETTVAPLTVETTALPDATEGEAYSETLQASGGDAPYGWSILSGALPDGLTLDPATGTIEGTPTSTGAHELTVRVTDDAAATDDQALTLVVAIAPVTALPAVLKASYDARVAWEKTVLGVFTIGVSLIGGTDTLGASYSETFMGEEDNISRDLRSFQTRMGRDDHDQPMREGTCTLTLRDEYDGGQQSGKYNPTNADGPLFGRLLPLRPAHLRARYGTTRSVFYGFTRNGEARPGPRRGTSQLDLVDFFIWLDRIHPIIAATGPTTTGAAIGLILDAAEWTEPSMRRLDDGDTIPDFTADGSENAITLIAKLLEAERGVFFIDKDGVAVYEDRHAWASKTRRASITSGMRALGPGFALDRIKNRARVTREGGVQQEHIDQDSVDEYGYSDHAEITTAYLTSDEQAASLAAYMVLRTKDPIGPLWQLELDGRTPELLAAMLDIRLQDWIQVTEASSGTVGDYIVEQIAETVDERGVHRASYTLSERPTHQPFRIGVSRIGGTHVLAY